MATGKKAYPNLQGGGDRAPTQDALDPGGPNVSSPSGPSSSALQTPTPSRRGRRTERGPRQLVRWDNDLDIQLLLTIQQACNATGVKIPWQLVAETMGRKFTEGAIIQHLSKVRVRREAEGKEVPPPLRRSIPSQGGSSNKKKRPVATPSREDPSPEKTPSMPVKESSKKRSGVESEEDPSWSSEERKRRRGGSRPQTSGKRVKTTQFDDYDDSDEDDWEGLDLDKPVCVGAPFLKFGSDTPEKNDDSDYEESDEEVAAKPERMILKLPIDPERLHRLESQGSVGTPSRKGTTPISTPIPGARNLPIRSSPTQNPDWSHQGHSQMYTMQSQIQSSPMGYSPHPFSQNFASVPVSPMPMSPQGMGMNVQPFHTYPQPPGAFNQAMMQQVQQPIPQHGVFQHSQQLPQSALMGDNFSMNPSFVSTYPSTSVPTTVDPQLLGTSAFATSLPGNVSGLPSLMHGPGPATAYTGIGDQSASVWVDDAINWGESANDTMGSSPEPDFNDTKMSN